MLTTRRITRRLPRLGRQPHLIKKLVRNLVRKLVPQYAHKRLHTMIPRYHRQYGHEFVEEGTGPQNRLILIAHTCALKIER